MKYYFERDPIYKQSIESFVNTAFIGATDRNTSDSIFFFDDIEKVPVSKDNMVIGTIKNTVEYLKKLDIEIPKPLNIPDELMSHVSRNISIQTFGEFKKSHKLPIFIKPYQSVKANDLKDSQNYASGVITKESSISFYDGMPDDYLVMTSDVVNFVSEYRCFVNRGEILSSFCLVDQYIVLPSLSINNLSLNSSMNSSDSF